MPPQRRPPSTRKHQSVATRVKKTVGNGACTSIFSMDFRGSMSTSAVFKTPDGESVTLFAADEADKLLPPLMRKKELLKRFHDSRRGRRMPNPVRDCRLPIPNANAANLQAPAYVPPLFGHNEQVFPVQYVPLPNLQQLPQQHRAMSPMVVDLYPVASTSRIPYPVSASSTSQASFSSLASASAGHQTAPIDHSAATDGFWAPQVYTSQLNHH